jgi:hypothetical protein
MEDIPCVLEETTNDVDRKLLKIESTRLHCWGADSRVPASTRGLGGSLSYTKSMWGCKLDGLLIWMMWVLAWIEVCLVVYYREEVKNKKY